MYKLLEVKGLLPSILLTCATSVCNTSHKGIEHHRTALDLKCFRFGWKSKQGFFRRSKEVNSWSSSCYRLWSCRWCMLLAKSLINLLPSLVEEIRSIKTLLKEHSKHSPILHIARSPSIKELTIKPPIFTSEFA